MLVFGLLEIFRLEDSYNTIKDSSDSNIMDNGVQLSWNFPSKKHSSLKFIYNNLYFDRSGHIRDQNSSTVEVASRKICHDSTDGAQMTNKLYKRLYKYPKQRT